MASKKEKVGLLLLGIFLGLVVAASLLWWQQHMLNKDWFSFKGVQQAYNYLFDRKDDVLTLTKKDKQGKQQMNNRSSRDKVSGDSLDAQLDSLLMSDSADISYLFEDGSMEYYIEPAGNKDSLPAYLLDKRRKGLTRDSIQSDSTLVHHKNKAHPEDFEVKRDQYISSRLLKVAGFPDSLIKSGGRMDSILTNDTRTFRLPSNIMRIEFWRSPINYTGYKMSSNRLVLFGSFNADEIRLEYVNDKVYLHYKNNYYPLEINDDFQSLVAVKKP